MSVMPTYDVSYFILRRKFLVDLETYHEYREFVAPFVYFGFTCSWNDSKSGRYVVDFDRKVISGFNSYSEDGLLFRFISARVIRETMFNIITQLDNKPTAKYFHTQIAKSFMPKVCKTFERMGYKELKDWPDISKRWLTIDHSGKRFWFTMDSQDDERRIYIPATRSVLELVLPSYVKDGWGKYTSWEGDLMKSKPRKDKPTVKRKWGW